MAGQDVVPNYRVGAYYAVGAAMATAIAAVGWPWASLLLWPAISCGIVAAGYFGVGPGVYGKRRGRLGILARLVMAPVLLGQNLSLRHYRRQGRAWDRAVPELIMGRVLTDEEARTLVESGVGAVLDLTAEFSEAKPLRQTRYLNLQILDLTAPTAAQWRRAVEFIREGMLYGLVYVHCKIGYSRTAAVVGAYLLASRHVESAEEAMALMRAKRSPLVIRPEVVTALRAFERESRATDSNH